MLEIHDQPRGSGKTTKVIKMLREDENAVALVPSEILARIAHPFDLKDGVFSARCGTDSALERYKNGNPTPLSDILGNDYTSNYPYGFTLEFGNFEIGRCVSPISLPDFSDMIIDMTLDDMYEQVGGASDGYLDDFSKEDKRELNDMIHKFISEKYPTWFYRIDDVRLVEIK